MNQTSVDTDISNFPESYWRTYPLPHFPPMTTNNETQVGVIGGGIAGVITAYLLTKAGKQVTLVEARDFLSGVTGHTTAKITAQHRVIYDELIRTFGKENARLYYEANIEGLALIKNISEELEIDCDFEMKKAVVYATTTKGAQQITKEAQAYEELGITAYLTEGRLEELPFDTKLALTMPEQAQFHPVKFLAALIKEIQRLGGKIYEHTRAVELKDETTVIMENGTTLHCEKVVVASHYPFNDFNGLYFSKLTISRSYALAVQIMGTVPNGMYISVESPTRSLRAIRDKNGKELLLMGGDSHQTGKSESHTQDHYHNLGKFVQKFFPIQAIPFHWSAQDMTTLDKVPYIGQISKGSPDVLVATGFNKWGMAMGAFSGKLLTDLIVKEPTVYAEFFSPTRGKLKATDIKQFVTKNATVGKDLIVSKVRKASLIPEDLQLDEGGLVTVEGEKLGGYRDEAGQLHLVKTTCTHLGCGLTWNNAERSWDCPCHGSRFSYSGEVLDGPAVRPLENRNNIK